MEKQLDAGPVYKKDELNLDGSAEQIFMRMAKLAIEQIKYIIEKNPTPIAQSKEKKNILSGGIVRIVKLKRSNQLKNCLITYVC